VGDSASDDWLRRISSGHACASIPSHIPYNCVQHYPPTGQRTHLVVLRRRAFRKAGELRLQFRLRSRIFFGNRSIVPLSRRRGLGLTLLYLLLQLLGLPFAVALAIVVLAVAGLLTFSFLRGTPGSEVIAQLLDPAKFLSAHRWLYTVWATSFSSWGVRLFVAISTLGLVLGGHAIFSRRHAGILVSSLRPPGCSR
jgi:hypothetical protein